MKSKEEKLLIADSVLDWYENWLRKNTELENKLLEEINVDDVTGRFEVIMLGTLFSQWGVSEDRAYKTWLKIKQWFIEQDADYFSCFSGEDSNKWEELMGNPLSKGVISKSLNNLQVTAKKLEKFDWDIESLVVKSCWKKTLTKIQDVCKGINQKAFWIARVMKQKDVWEIPGEFCCVSDIHVKSFLEKARFTYDTSDLFYNSKIIWEYFNQGRPQHHFDLSIFRFARNRKKKCKKCSTEPCNLINVQNCGKM